MIKAGPADDLLVIEAMPEFDYEVSLVDHPPMVGDLEPVITLFHPKYNFMYNKRYQRRKLRRLKAAGRDPPQNLLMQFGALS